MTEAIGRAKVWLESPTTYRVFQLVAIGSLLLALGVGVQQHRLASCLARYSEATSQSTALRAAAAEADRKALDDLVTAIVEARRSADSSAVDKALGTYLQTRAFADGQRAGKPLPAPPSQTCG